MSKSQQQSSYNNAGGQMTTNNTNEANANSLLGTTLGNASSNASSLLPSITGGYSDIASTGGYDPTALNTLNTTETNLATNGGLDPDAVSAMKSEASNAASSAYTGAQADAQRKNATTGGYGYSGDIASSLARQGSNASAQAAENESGVIAGLQQQGEIAGTNAMNTTQQNLAGNKLAAVGGETNVYGMNQQQVTSTLSQILQNYQQTGQLNNQDLAIMSNLANQPGVFSQIINTIGTLGGAAAGIIGSLPTGGSLRRIFFWRHCTSIKIYD